MSRLSKRIKAIDQAREGFKPVLKAVKELHTELCDNNGFCGSNLCLLISQVENNIKYIINNSAQGLINEK